MSGKQFKLTAGFIEKYKDSFPRWGFGALGHVVYQRTYSRPLEDGTNEKWFQTVQRVVEGAYNAQYTHCEKNGLPWNAQKAQLSAQKMYALIHDFKFLPPGRGLWAMGTDYVERRGSAALNNCAFISTENIKRDFSYPFTFLMDMSMLGVGVGSDTRGASTINIVTPSVSLEPFVIPDSREGWVDSVRVLLEAFVGKGSLPIFDYSLLRKKGEKLKGFGGISSGAEPLKELHEELMVLYYSNGFKPISSTMIVDTFNLIGRCVVAGGIRRTAEIMLGDPSDTEFLELKDPKKHSEKLMQYRWASNNSLIVPVGSDYSKYVDQIMQNGEPGFFWLDNARKYGRMVKQSNDDLHDPYVMGQNPCGEISLESGEFCNLAEVYPANHDTFEEFCHTLKFAYLYAKTVSLIPTHNLHTNAIIGRNRRIGVSVTGITQAISKLGVRTFFNWMDSGYRYLRQMDNEYSKWLCVPNSIKLTTVKPSGTVSLLTGSTPGIHFPHSEYYIRRVRFDGESELTDKLKKAGFNCADSVMQDNTIVVDFPVKEEHFIKSKFDVSIWEQFELAAQMQHWWADNSVSVTVSVREEERKDLARALSLYESRLKSVSILPLETHGYVQAPYEQITEKEYIHQMGSIKDMDLTVSNAHDIEEAGCTTDTCSII